jgi:hypothetical protein
MMVRSGVYRCRFLEDIEMSTRRNGGSSPNGAVSPLQKRDRLPAECNGADIAPADDPLLVQLRELYNSVASEPIPEALRALLQRLKS